MRDMEVALLAKSPIRNKLFVCVGLLVVLVVTLSASGFLGVYAYRNLVRNLRDRADELPLATELAQRVSDLRVSLTETGPAREILYSTAHRPDVQLLRRSFQRQFRSGPNRVARLLRAVAETIGRAADRQQPSGAKHGGPARRVVGRGGRNAASRPIGRWIPTGSKS